MTTVALVACVKAKQSQASPAQDLYTSPLFRAMRSYAERHADDWFVLSAKYGLLERNQVVAPYERTLKTLNREAQRRWGQSVCQALEQHLPAHAGIIILAGASYRKDIEPFLRDRGHHVLVPMQGMSIGKQLAWLKQQNEA